MLRKKALFIVLLLASFIQPASASTSTGNQFVTAVVEDDSALIWFLDGSSPTVPPSTQLSYPKRSFLSILIGTTVFSNNYQASLDRLPDFQLDNGITTKTVDTIETIWHENNRGFLFDIVQDVYPVAFENSGQIVVKVRVINHEKSAFLDAQAQFLLDPDIDSNDRASTLTRFGYSNQWQYFPNAQQSIPPYYACFENAPATGDFGHAGMGYLDDSSAPHPLGLIEPESFTIGDWLSIPSDPAGGLKSFVWSFPSNVSSNYSDNGVVITWPPVSAQSSGPDTDVEIGRTSFGTGQFEVCQGNVIAVNLFPRRLVYDLKTISYIQNPFEVESILFNPSATKPITDVDISQIVKGPVQIISPLPVTGGGQAQVQHIANIPPLGVSELIWLDSATGGSGTTYDSAATLSISSTIPFALDCQLQMVVEGTKHDPIPPIVSVQSRTGSANGSDCNARSIVADARDTGALISGVKSVTAQNLKNMTFSVSEFSPGDETVLFTLGVVDSMYNGSATVIISDVSDNRDTEIFNYCTILDTLPPTIEFDTVAGGHLQVLVRDDRPWDRGVAFVEIKDSTNVLFDPPAGTLIEGTPEYVIPFRPRDPQSAFTLCLDALDKGYQVSVVECYDGTANEDLGVTGTSQPSTALTIYPNPVTDVATIALSGGPTATVELLDVLGRTLDRFHFDASSDARSNTINTERLSSGIYMLRITTGGSVVTGRIVKQ